MNNTYIIKNGLESNVVKNYRKGEEIMTWRITHSKAPRSSFSAISKVTGTITENVLIKATERIELREDDGTIVRLGAGAEFKIKDSPLGNRPEYFGPVCILKKGGCGKYRTSCYFAAANPLSNRPDIFIKPGSQPGVDEFYAISGDIVIYELDENSRTFNICIVHEGEKALIAFNAKAAKMQNRYKAKVMPYTDAEYEYVLKEFIDRRNWI